MTFFSRLRLLFVQDILVIEVRKEKEPDRHQLCLWGTIENPQAQAQILGALANSIQEDLEAAQQEAQKN